MPITIDGTGTITGATTLASTVASPTFTTPALGTPASGILTSCTGVPFNGFKNRIINGAMVIDQRNAGASVTLNNGDEKFPVDRFSTYQNTGTGVVTAQQSSTAPTGFTNSIKLTTTTANASLSAAQRWQFLQSIEGYNTADLGFGTANAQTVNLSFWVYSSLTGTFAGSLNNSAVDRSYVFNYTISNANTWEQKTITIAGDTSGTWVGATNGIGIRVYLSLGAGTNYNTTAGSWATGFYTSTSGATSVVGTNGATFYITGVQLEKGSTASSFDYRPFGTELILAQRYFETTYPIGTAVGTASTDASAPVAFSMGDSSAVTQQIIWIYKVKKCSAPTVTVYNPNSGASGSARYAGTLNINFSTQGSRVDQATFGSGTGGMAINNTFSYYMTANSEL